MDDKIKQLTNKKQRLDTFRPLPPELVKSPQLFITYLQIVFLSRIVKTLLIFEVTLFLDSFSQFFLFYYRQSTIFEVN